MSNAIPFRRFGTMIDCSRNAVMSLPALKKWVDILALLLSMTRFQMFSLELTTIHILGPSVAEWLLTIPR